jgi:hypothetical protein
MAQKGYITHEPRLEAANLTDDEHPSQRETAIVLQCSGVPPCGPWRRKNPT